MSHNGKLSSAQHETVPLIQKIAWGTGGMADNLLGWSIVYLALPIYNIALGVDPIVIGWAMALPRIFDAIIDPFIGNWSDNTRSRWGRRRPFIFVAGFIAAVCFMVTWMPPFHASKTALGIFFVVSTCLTTGTYAFFVIPYYALGIELSTDYNERTRVQSWRFFFIGISQIVMPWLYKVAIMIGEALPVEAVKPEIVGIRYVGIGIGVLVLLIVVMICIFCREKNEVHDQRPIGFIESVMLTTKNPAFIILMVVCFFTLFGFFLVNPMALYLNIYYIFAGDKGLAATMSGFCGMMVGVVGIAAPPLIAWLSTRFGKKNIFVLGAAVALIGFLSNWFFVTPAHPYWNILPWLLISPGTLTLWVVGSSLMADICDLDELNTGMRREGVYGAVFATITKMGTALSMLFSGYLLAWSGFNAEIIPTDAVLFNIRILYVLVPAGFMLVSLFFAILLPVSTKRIHEVRMLLDARNAQAAEAAKAGQAET